MQIGMATAELMDRDPANAVRVVFELRYGQLVALAEVILGDSSDAEDVVQDAFASVIRRRTMLRDDVAGYIVQSVVNGARSRLRRRAVERRPRSLERPLESASESGELLDLVRRLPNRQAQVIVCRYVLDLTFSQTATVLEISRGSVRTHAARGIKQLERWIEEER